MPTPHIGSEVLLFCDAMNEMLMSGGGRSSRDRAAMLAGASVFFEWGEATPTEALRFASSLASQEPINAAESMALCLAHLGALRGQSISAPFQLTTQWEQDPDDEGGMESVMRPSMSVSRSMYSDPIDGFGSLPPRFAKAASGFMDMVESHWVSKSLDIMETRGTIQLAPDQMLDDTLREMSSSLYAFDLEAQPDAFKRIKVLAEEAALQATLRDQIKDPATPRAGGMRV